MATIHFALDAAGTGFTYTAGYGRIAGWALSLQGLRDQGFAAATYRGNRLSTIEHTDAGWDSDCERGWYRTPDGVQIAQPQTQAAIDLAALQNAFRSLHTQLHGWADGLDALARGQPQEAVNTGHDFLFHAHEAAYLIGRDSTTYSAAQRIAWAGSMATGAADVQSPAQFYQRVREGSGIAAPTTPITWVNPADATKLNLASATAVTGTVPTAADLSNGGWIDALTA